MSSTAARPTRWIFVDDTNPGITYLGPDGSWFSADGISSTFTRNDSSGILNSNGPVYNGTQHGTRQASSFSFDYSGAKIEAVGTIEYGNRNKDGLLSWHCYVDGQEIKNATNITSQPADNIWLLCGDWQTGGSGDGPHTLTVNITATRDLPFWLDFLAYTPSSNVPLENKTIRLDLDDPIILAALSSGWDVGLDQTTNQGSTFNLEFVGTAFSWWGMARLDNYDPPANGTAIGTFSVDDGPKLPVNFPSVASRGHWFGQKFFDTGSLPMGKHKVAVEYTDSGKYPLGLTYVRIQNGSFTDPSSSSSNAPAPHSSSKTTTIIAAVIPAVVVVLLLIAAGIYIKRRRKQRQERETYIIDQSPTMQTFSQPESPTIVPYSDNSPSPDMSSTFNPYTGYLTYTPPTSKSAMFSASQVSRDSPVPGSYVERNYQATESGASGADDVASSSGAGGSQHLARRPTYMTDAPPPSYTPHA